MPAAATGPGLAGPGRGGHPGQYRPALAGLPGRGQPVKRGADRDVTGDDLSEPEHRHAAVASRRVALRRCDVRHEIGARGPVRAAVVAGDDAPRDAGQAVGQPVELADLGPYEVLPVRVRCTRDHAARLAVHGPHHGQVDRRGELAQPPPRTRRGNRFGRHGRTVAGRDTRRRRAALDQGGGRVEHGLVLIRVGEVAHRRQRFVHAPRMPGRPAPGHQIQLRARYRFVGRRPASGSPARRGRDAGGGSTRCGRTPCRLSRWTGARHIDALTCWDDMNRGNSLQLGHFRVLRSRPG